MHTFPFDESNDRMSTFLLPVCLQSFDVELQRHQHYYSWFISLSSITTLPLSHVFHYNSSSLSRPVPAAARGHPLHQGDQPQRGLDVRRFDRHHRRRQLLRRPPGGVRHDARVERADHAARHQGADATEAHTGGGGGHVVLQVETVL